MDFRYAAILSLIQEYHDPKRYESASFLIWYLINYYRLDHLEAVDSVCDQRGDKGIDGIVVNDNAQTIIVFQSRLSQSERTVGDSGLREFAGTLAHFKDSESVGRLIESAGRAEVASLVKRLEIVKKVKEYEVRGEYLTNIDLDCNGAAFLQQVPVLDFVGRTVLNDTFISDERDVPIHKPVSFDVSSFQITEYSVDTDNRTFIAPIRANDLIQLDGISNQTLFTHNVRGPLGRTNVNKAIKESVRNHQLHKRFPLFHNGITMIAGDIEADENKITISDYFVVNGCQSLTALYYSQDNLTDNLYVLTKFIKVEPTSLLAKQITEFSNNQNGVKPRDFKANSSTQIRLQNEFKDIYEGRYYYEIKRGEESQSGTIISNEDAGLYLMAFDLKEPWGTHRKYEVFDDKHGDIFNRTEVTADRIVMCHVLREESEIASKEIDNTLFGKYVLTRYLLMFIVRQILEDEELGQEVIRRPENFVRSEENSVKFKESIRTLLTDVVIDLNDEVEQYGDDFDYRGRLRDEKWVVKLARTITTDRKKQVARKRIPSFKDDWESC
ncbi:MAG: AIPR family protein [Gammaproteobacteria bacterium]|nr:AIPR family protein [Gammaproteobacteria bacterium]